MTILLFLFGVAVAAGLFFILADILKLPRLSTEKALLSAGRTEKKRMKSLDALFLGWAIRISAMLTSTPLRSCYQSCIRNGASRIGATLSGCEQRIILLSLISMT